MSTIGQVGEEPEEFVSGDPNMDNLNRFIRRLRDQDDRGLVLSVAAFAEDTLGRLLISYFKKCRQANELVEGFNAPLGTFATRIKAWYSMGLLVREQHDDLEIARKVRNAFAHDWEGVTLSRNDIAALIGQLHCYTLDHREITGGPRERLLESISTICIELRVLVGSITSGRVKRAPTVAFRLTTLAAY